MEREIIKIDEELCDGCGLCIPNCHEGALQIIDEKAVLISDLMCDGLGACTGHCPQGALTIEKREAEAYDEVSVMKEMVRKGRNVVIAHMKHLKDHREHDFLKQGVQYLLDNKHKLEFNPVEVIQAVHNHGKPESLTSSSGAGGNGSSHDPHSAVNILSGDTVTLETGSACGCPGSREMAFHPAGAQASQPGGEQALMPEVVQAPAGDQPSALRQWPVQLHLINPGAGYFQGADLLVSADCVAYALGNFHSSHLRNKSLVIACPKLDSNMDIYQQKITALIDQARVNTITVMIMEVPCCGGLIKLVQSAAGNAHRKVPVKAIQVGVQGEILSEEWV